MFTYIHFLSLIIFVVIGCQTKSSKDPAPEDKATPHKQPNNSTSAGNDQDIRPGDGTNPSSLENYLSGKIHGLNWSIETAMVYQPDSDPETFYFEFSDNADGLYKRCFDNTDPSSETELTPNDRKGRPSGRIRFSVPAREGSFEIDGDTIKSQNVFTITNAESFTNYRPALPTKITGHITEIGRTMLMGTFSTHGADSATSISGKFRIGICRGETAKAALLPVGSMFEKSVSRADFSELSSEEILYDIGKNPGDNLYLEIARDFGNRDNLSPEYFQNGEFLRASEVDTEKDHCQVHFNGSFQTAPLGYVQLTSYSGGTTNKFRFPLSGGRLWYIDCEFGKDTHYTQRPQVTYGQFFQQTLGYFKLYRKRN